jgi:hypothetical protein
MYSTTSPILHFNSELPIPKGKEAAAEASKASQVAKPDTVAITRLTRTHTQKGHMQLNILSI